MYSGEALKVEISSSVQNNPALILLQATLQAVTLATPAVQQLSDAVDISDAAKQLAQAVSSLES